MTAWKDLERRICRLLGGERTGPTGRACSDCTDAVPFVAQIKRSTRPGPPVLSRWIAQARYDARRDRLARPWLVVVAGHNDRRPIVCLDLFVFAELCQDAGRIPRPLIVDAALELEAAEGECDAD